MIIIIVGTKNVFPLQGFVLSKIMRIETITILGVAGYEQAIRWTVVHVGEGGDEAAKVGRGL